MRQILTGLAAAVMAASAAPAMACDLGLLARPFHLRRFRGGLRLWLQRELSSGTLAGSELGLSSPRLWTAILLCEPGPVLQRPGQPRRGADLPGTRRSMAGAAMTAATVTATAVVLTATPPPTITTACPVCRVRWSIATMATGRIATACATVITPRATVMVCVRCATVTRRASTAPASACTVRACMRRITPVRACAVRTDGADPAAGSSLPVVMKSARLRFAGGRCFCLRQLTSSGRAASRRYRARVPRHWRRSDS